MPANLSSILKLEVPLIVVIATRLMPVKDVMNLTPGAIIELPKLADEELELLVNNKRIGSGHAVKVGENFGIRVAYVGNLKDRIAALAGSNGIAEVDGVGVTAPTESTPATEVPVAAGV